MDINNQEIKILGTKVNRMSMSQTMQEITVWANQEEKHYICTADAYMLYLASNDNKLQEVINNASIVTPDSSGTILASKICKTPINNKVSGCVLAENLCKESSENNLRIFFLGAKPGIAETAAKKMKAKYKNMIVAGTHHGYFKDEENDDIIRLINESNANILFVAFGIPKQEFWIAENLPKLNVKVAMGIGGTFDVMSETVQRAPVFFQKTNLEWLYRFFQDPKKSYKLKILPKFFIKVLKYKANNDN
ncbi:MAG: WecB/TagA/CpsF family glycosyltransferase [Armatimonadetes bacterium]|nr:WecB/TagA/CpsF family glycosyltransferase [Candidatus Hippobium faecium]